MFLMRNPSNPSAFMALSLDDIKITMEEEETQTYDALGRIDENNVGTYNYTNVNPSNSVPKHFQNSSIETNSEYSDYYLSRANLDITYNAFKSPIDIIEEGKDKLSFIYNMNNSRSTMYYGSLEADKLSRRFRKHYAADGSMEIKQDMVNGTVEFITYIGGDAYSAPIILKSDGTTQNYLYLHRDYLGSIVAITNQAGVVEEKRHFDAWGNITKVQDGAGNNLTKLTVIDRGYTGHEHLQGVNLIHMNGRLYDPVIHRFLQPDNFVSDPQNTQAFNRYSYVLNNPLKYSDASGELPVLVVAAIVGAIAGGAGYIAHAIQTGNWSWSGFGMAVVGGAAVGALTGGLGGATATCVTLSAAGNAAASSFAMAFFPAINVPVGDWSFSISPSIAFGNASGAGVSFGVSYSDGDWSFSGGVGIMSYGNYKDGLIREYTTDNNFLDGRVEDSKLMWALGNYSRFIRPGAVRLSVSAFDQTGALIPDGDTDQQGLMCSAYKNVDGTYVMVVINYANEEKEFSIDKEKVGNAQWQVYRTSDKEGENLLPVGKVKSGKTVHIPARSIITLQSN
jgi:RHS repeat-associated protein